MTSKARQTRKRLYRVNRIKQTCTYDPAQMAKLIGVHRNTVRHWLKHGLAAIDDRRPALVHGAVLKAFLKGRQQSRQQKCAPGEFYCFRCRAPREPSDGAAALSLRSDKIANLSARCKVCETQMHRAIRRSDVPKFAAVLRLQTLAPERLNDREVSCANSDFEKDPSHVETEPAE